MRRKSNGKGEVVDFAFKFWEKMAGWKAQPATPSRLSLH